MMEQIAGEKVSRSRWGSVEWIGRHEEIQPKPGYVAFKAALYAHYDLNFRRFLDPSFRFLIRPEEIEWGGVTKDGIPALTNPRHLLASEAKYLRGLGPRVRGLHQRRGSSRSLYQPNHIALWIGTKWRMTWWDVGDNQACP